MATCDTQQGERRPRQPRPGDGSTALTAPFRNPKTGQFEPENDFARLRRLKAAYRVGFVGLNPEEVVPYLRPFVELANADATRLIEETGAAGSQSLTGLAEAAANAHAFARGLQALAATGDKDAQEQARHWLREYRQLIIALRAEARTPLRITDDGDEKAVEAANKDAEKRLELKRAAERRAREEADAADGSELAEPSATEGDEAK